MSDDQLPIEKRLQIFGKNMICPGCGCATFTGWCSQDCKDEDSRRTLRYVLGLSA